MTQSKMPKTHLREDKPSSNSNKTFPPDNYEGPSGGYDDGQHSCCYSIMFFNVFNWLEFAAASMDMFDNDPVDFSDLDQLDVPAKPVDHDPAGSSTDDKTTATSNDISIK